MGSCRNFSLGVGKNSLRCGDRGQPELPGGPGPVITWGCLVPRLLDTQALLDAKEELRTECPPTPAGGSAGAENKGENWLIKQQESLA